MLRELFADPELAADPRYANVLRAYLREDSIPPLPLRRMAEAFPGNVDGVYRRVLGNRNFSWSQNGSGCSGSASLATSGRTRRQAWRCSATACSPWPRDRPRPDAQRPGGTKSGSSSRKVSITPR